jgi:outer membrane murein-binding lipoprotein Lpp
METKTVERKKLVTLAAICAVFIISTAGSIVYSTSILTAKNQQINSLQEDVAPLNAQIDSLNATVQQLNGVIAQKNEALDSLNNKIIDLNSQIANLTSQVASLTDQLNGLNNQVTIQSNLVIDSITVTDERSNTTSGALHISCRVNNTGTSIAYSTFIHTTAISDDGIVIDDYHPFGGLTGGMSLTLDFSVNYTGAPITRWMVTPIWTGQPPTTSIGTLP